jgi:hypothetical protein
MEEIMKIWPALAFITNLIIAWALWSLNKKFATREELSSLDTKIKAIEGKLSVGHVCFNQDSIHKLEIATTELSGKVETLSALIGRMEKTLSRQEDYLLNKGRAKSE